MMPVLCVVLKVRLLTFLFKQKLTGVTAAIQQTNADNK